MNQHPHQPDQPPVTWGTAQTPQPPTAPQPKPKPKGSKALGFGCFGIIALLIAGAAIAVSTNDSDSSDPSSQSAAVMCESFVKRRLKSPATADFPGVSDADYAKTTTLSDTKPWKYKVTGVVDSQNGFGAVVRSTYVCTVSTKDNDTWTLDDLDLVQR